MAEMSVLVAYASKHGSTELIADVIGDALRRAGHDVDVRPVSDVRDLTRYGAAVVGSALYIGRWQGDALRFLRRHEASLAGMPVWFFSSGPLDDSAETAQLPAPKAVAEIAARIGARGHATFGGHLAPDASGFVEHLMIRGGRTGDWRNFERIEMWADAVAAELAREGVLGAAGREPTAGAVR